ncbi:glycosyltransferase [Acidisoma sp.]|uniref:glycosyltransferase n=1 Tax=Acidisoma sp. TaxID=1872115 RepID=UPI003B00FEF5
MAKPGQDRILMVIPSINGGELLARMLPTLRFASANIVVLDQGSTDETAAVCAEHDVQLVQLGRPHTYTEACNIGAGLARDRGADYVCVSNNDIVFRTPVLDEMQAEMDRDPRLGIVAPSQVVVDASLSNQPVSYRVSWHLDDVAFTHQTDLGEPAARRLEADFCELTCALVRLSAIDEIGFLDDEYGFYHEDADFGFRLGRAGYSCAYLPKSQIVHFISSTINREKISAKARYIARNKLYFARKHLGYGVNQRLSTPGLDEHWSLFTQEAHRCLRRYGLLDSEAPELITSYPGTETSGYLYTPYEAAELPDVWRRLPQRYRGIFTSTKAMETVFRRSGARYSFYVPPGVETDSFNPWGPVRRISGNKTFLGVVDGQQQQFLHTLLTGWSRFSPGRANVRLVLFGSGLQDALGRQPDARYQLGSIEIAHYEAERIDVHTALKPPSDQDLAVLYRSVDYAIVRSRSDNPSLPALQSMASGTPCIHVYHGSMTVQSAADVPGLVVAAPTDIAGERLAAMLEQVDALDERAREALTADGLYSVRGRFTLRHTAMGLYGALSHLQIRSPSKVIERLEHRPPAVQAISTSLAEAGATAVAAPAPVRWTVRRRLSGAVARRVRAVGNLTGYFGQIWQESGFRAAGRGLQAEVTQIVGRRTGRLPRLTPAGAPPPPVLHTSPIPETAPAAAPEGSVLLIGYIDAQLGLGQSLRGLALALSQTNLPFGIYPFGVGVEGRRSGSYMPERYDEVRTHTINVIEVGTNELPTVFAHVSEAHFASSYNILRTYWELSRAPEAWRDNLARIDEIWAPNPFIAESFRTIFTGPITVVPPCLDLPAITLDGRQHFGLVNGRFYFLFSFDYFSFPQRKNPLAVLRAFRKAFPDPSSPVGLVIKSTGAVDHFPALKRALRAAADDDERILVIDESLTRQEMLALLDATGCYVSLHRAEGFGFGLTEAMALAKPVIGTDYSGNTEFLTAATGYPIPYSLKPIGADEYIYPDGQVWAYPDEDACAAAMVRVFGEPEDARTRAAAGQRFVMHRYGPATVGHIVEQRVQEILAERAVAASPAELPA